ncbi:MAG TPA: TolC family protein, partial [Opitutaceae bacterium]|nr:TolC family protein [Opitutaceae bacterium]
MHRLRLVAAAVPLLFAACVSASRDEQAAREQVRAVGAALPAVDHRAELPALTADATLADDLRFALLNHPQVEAAFDEWRAAVLAIGPARALPDPKLTFQADIAGTLTSLMPGFMFDLMGPGRRAAMAGEAAAAAEAARRRYITA